MSGADLAAAPTGVQAAQADAQARLEAEMGGADDGVVVPGDELDQGDLAPGDLTESEAGDDGALASDGTEEEDSDLGEEAPDDDETESTDWEKRYKDSQQHIEATSAERDQAVEEVQRVREESAAVFAEMTDARYQLTDQLTEVQQTAEFYNNLAQQEVMRARQINFAAIPAHQVAQAQQYRQAAEVKYQQTAQALEQAKANAARATSDALAREAQISRAQLTREMPDFDTVYPQLGEFAISEGVNPKVFKDIVDPGLIRLINKAMKMTQTPDVIETVTKKPKAKTPKMRNADQLQRDTKGRFKQAEKRFHNSTGKERISAHIEATELRLAEEARGR